MALSVKIRRGQSLIELVVVMGLSALILPVLVSGLVASRQGRAQQLQRTEATAHLMESQEAMRVIRERGWSVISEAGVYHTVVENNTWGLVTGVEVVDDYTHQVTVSNVSRDASGVITTTGGTTDPSTKKIDIEISWSSPFLSSVSSTQYLTRYLDNLAFTETTQAQFDAGTKQGVATTNVSGGEIVLSGGGHGDWCQPDLTLAQVDLPKNGVANALTAIPATASSPGYAFAGTGDNASGVSFAKVDITDTDPPTAQIPSPGTFDGFKTNAIFGDTDYAYLATDNNSKEVEIISLTTNPYSESGYFNMPGSGNASSIFVSGSVGYVTGSPRLYTFDLGSKSGSRSQLGFVDLAGTGTKIQVIGSYAFVTTTSSSTPFQVINISNPTSPSVVAQAQNLSGQGATDVFVNTASTRGYVVTSLSSSGDELFVLDVSSKSGNLPVLAN
ncbi:MAG: hypothetical protein AAB909_05040, partial [Patescibacteria group bacterium]